MLILSRKKNQSIICTVPPSDVPRTVVFTCVEIRGDKTRVGIAADSDIPVHRDEVQRVIEQGVA